MLEGMKILVGVDGSATAEKALSEAITIAKHFSGSIKVMMVHDKGMEKVAGGALNQAKLSCDKEGVNCSISSILGSNPARALQETSTVESMDLIVVGSRGLGSAASILLGSVSRQIVANADCNVLVVKK